MITNKFWNTRNILVGILLLFHFLFILVLIDLFQIGIPKEWGAFILTLIFWGIFIFFTYYLFKQDSKKLESDFLSMIEKNKDAAYLSAGFIFGLFLGWPVMLLGFSYIIGILPVVIITYVLFKTLKPKNEITLFYCKLAATIIFIAGILLFILIYFYNLSLKISGG
ncbi:hypothetical protein HYT26_01385 [Candidatus Pacearchaeota archaeon]|nr:hypothetical protein [Candidatus Pacearchaeota archaeon]